LSGNRDPGSLALQGTTTSAMDCDPRSGKHRRTWPFVLTLMRLPGVEHSQRCRPPHRRFWERQLPPLARRGAATLCRRAEMGCERALCPHPIQKPAYRRGNKNGGLWCALQRLYCCRRLMQWTTRKRPYGTITVQRPPSNISRMSRGLDSNGRGGARIAKDAIRARNSFGSDSRKSRPPRYFW